MKMNTLASLIILLLLTACATESTKNSSSSAGADSNELEEDLAWIKNEDFLPVQETPFNIRDDFFREEVANSSLSRETIERAPDVQLRKISSSEDVVGRIVSLCYRGNFALAEKEMDESFEKLKSHPSYWNQVGTCYMTRGLHRQALLYYNRALDIEKNYAPAINNIGVMHFREGHHQKALAAFKEASELNTFSLTPSFNLAQVHLQYGFIDEAEQVFLALRRQNTEEPEILHALATIALLKNDATRAVGIYRLLDRNFLTHQPVGVNFSIALKIVGRPQDAKAILSNIERTQDSTSDVYLRQVEQFVGN